MLAILEKIPGGHATMDEALIYRADAISYTYPPAVVQLERNLVKTKKAMQADGRADQIAKGCVRFEDLRKPK